MKRALLVEDDRMNRKLMRDVLEIRFLVQEADSAEQAQRLLLNNRPDLIFLDVGLPGGSGLAFLRELKASPETADIPVVVVSAHAMPGEVAEGWESGCAEYVTKPIMEDPYQFTERMARLIQIPQAC